MCNSTEASLRWRCRSHESLPAVAERDVAAPAAPKLPPVVKRLEPYNTKGPIGHFTAKHTSPEHIMQKHDRIDAPKCLVANVGLENFIRGVVRPLNLRLPDRVDFNMNGRGRMRSWEDVFLAERVYTSCLGISKRIYQMHAFTHEPERRLAYFVLEEHNERSWPCLPAFDFYVLVFTYYDAARNVTRVDVQYDQLSFFLHCLGLAQGHAWWVETVVTPLALAWARAYHASGLAGPATFLLQLIVVPMALLYWIFWA